MKKPGKSKFQIEYLSSVVEEDIPKLSKTVREEVRSSIESKLTISPEVFGKPLRESLKGFRALRVGDIRVVFLIKNKTVLVVIIRPRSLVYKEVLKRI